MTNLINHDSITAPEAFCTLLKQFSYTLKLVSEAVLLLYLMSLSVKVLLNLVVYGKY